jgi:hypothetical protein
MAFPVKTGALLLGAGILIGSVGFAVLKPEPRKSQAGLIRPYKSRELLNPSSNASAPASPAAEDDGTPAGAISAPAPTVASDHAPVEAATLPDGEYACYGSGSTVLAGLGFKTVGGSYTDLDGGNAGKVTVQGTDVIFTGGHLDGQRGRDLKGKSFRIASMAVCEKW